MKGFSLLVLVIISLLTYGQQPKLMLHTGHVLGVSDASFSYDGKYVFTVGEDDIIKMWEIASGRLIHDFEGSNLEGFLDSGRTLITVKTLNDHQTGIVQYWDLITGQLIKQHAGVNVRLNSGKTQMLLGRGVDSTGNDSMDLVDVKSGKKTHAFPGTIGAFLNSDSIIFSGSLAEDANSFDMYVWDAATKKLHSQYKGYLAGASDKHFVIQHDSTLYVFDIATAEQVQAFSLPKNKYGNFEDFKASFSPDSRKVYLYRDYIYRTDEIFVFDTDSFSLLKQLYAPKDVSLIFFSSDGNLTVVVDDENSATVYDTGYNILYQLEGHTDIINRLDFDPDDKYILTASEDKKAILWDAATGKKIRQFKGDNKLISICTYSPDKNTFCYQSGGNLFIWETATLKKIATIQVPDANITYSADGKFIYLSNNYYYFFLVIEAGTGKIVSRHFDEQNQWSTGATYSYDGAMAGTYCADSVFRIFTVSGDTVFSLYGKDPNLTRFSHGNNKALLVYSTYEKYEHIADTLVLYDITTGRKDWTIGFKGTELDFVFSPGNSYIAGTVGDSLLIINTLTGNVSYAPAYVTTFSEIEFTADEKLILVTTSRYRGFVCQLVYNTETGRKFASKKRPHDESLYIIRTAFIENNTKVITSYISGETEIWDIYSGYVKNIYSPKGYINDFSGTQYISTDRAHIYFFDTAFNHLYTLSNLDSANYVVMDKDGRFDGTEAGRKQMYYTCGQETIDLEQFKNLCWEPGLIGKITGDNQEPITAKKISEINICNYTPVIKEKGNEKGFYKYEITPRKGGIGEVQLYINGKQVKTYTTAGMQKKGGSYTLSVPHSVVGPYLVRGAENQLSVRATTTGNTMSARSGGGMELIADESEQAANPDMFIVSIGISKYKGERLKLNYAAKDAVDFSAALAHAGRKLLNNDGKEHVNTFTFHTEPGSTRWPAKQAIRKLMDSIAGVATADDILVIFFAGHGTLSGPQKTLYLLTAEATDEGIKGVEDQVAISTGEMDEWMRKIKANKQLLILDACNSGQVVKNMQNLMAQREIPADQLRALENLKDKTGTYILSASASGQSAYETSIYSQGLLTYSLLSSIKLGKGLKDNKFIDVTKWFNSASDDVRILAKDIGGRQDPQILGTASFEVGLADKEVLEGIQLAIAKKIFARSKLIGDEESLSDELNLSGLIDKELTNLSSRGKESPLTFAPDNTLANTYSVRGRYEVTGSTVVVKITIYMGSKEKLHQFEVSGDPEKPEALARSIVEKVKELLGN
ncbi:MAG TPA: caspase family protein [Bacteroidia bacterium]|nr:caspase family protein [Bacteroidia bacterium]